MTIEQIARYVTGGKAIFTIQSTKIDKRYTYKVRQDKSNYERFLVDILYGPDNCNDYRLMGYFYTDNFTLRTPKREIVSSADNRYRMFMYFLQFLCTEEALPDTCKFYPSGRCARCGRLLTTPESIESGFGPECIKYVEV